MRTRCQVPTSILAFVLAACAAPAPSQPKAVGHETPYVPQLTRLDPARCHAVLRDDTTAESLQQALARSVGYYEKLPPERSFTTFGQQVSAGEMLRFLLALPQPTADGTWQTAVCDRARVYRVELPEGMLITGYYQPELRASRTRTSQFRYPLYRAPDDLIDADLSAWDWEGSRRVIQGRIKEGRLVPYYSRGEIDAGILNGRGYEIAWLEDPVDAFFMHVQGSAILRFADGVQMHVSYSNSNGRPYTSIGRVLIDRGKLSRENVSMQSLREYLRAHPDEQAEIMATNQRYIFFRTVPNGPIGSLAVPLTAGRSLAADAAVYPPGALVFVKIDVRAENLGQTSTARFALIQDAGIAITGPSRLDVYWGTGNDAAEIAGGMRNPGELYLILP